MGTFISQDVISNGHYETSSLKHRKHTRHTKCKKQSKNVAEKVSFAILVLLLCENMLWFEKLDFQYAKRNSKVCNQQKQNWFVFKSMTYEMRLILNLRSLMMRKRPVRRKISNSFRDHQLKGEVLSRKKNFFVQNGDVTHWWWYGLIWVGCRPSPEVFPLFEQFFCHKKPSSNKESLSMKRPKKDRLVTKLSAIGFLTTLRMGHRPSYTSFFL